MSKKLPIPPYATATWEATAKYLPEGNTFVLDCNQVRTGNYAALLVWLCDVGIGCLQQQLTDAKAAFAEHTVLIHADRQYRIKASRMGSPDSIKIVAWATR